MSNQKKVRVLYVGFTKHGFLWLKRRRTWLVQVARLPDTDSNGMPETCAQFVWTTVSKHFDKADANLEGRLWTSNQN